MIRETQLRDSHLSSPSRAHFNRFDTRFRLNFIFYSFRWLFVRDRCVDISLCRQNSNAEPQLFLFNHHYHRLVWWHACHAKLISCFWLKFALDVAEVEIRMDWPRYFFWWYRASSRDAWSTCNKFLSVFHWMNCVHFSRLNALRPQLTNALLWT